MNTSILSAGQRQVRQIAAQIWDDFPNSLSLSVLAKEYKHDAYEALLSRLKEDQVIKDDLYTGCRVDYMEVAMSYVEWIGSTKGPELTAEEAGVIEGFLLHDKFNRICFNGSAVESQAGPVCINVPAVESQVKPICLKPEPPRLAYQGGYARESTTARAVLTRIKGGYWPSYQTGSTYYVNSKIMDVGTGNHRFLALKLLGDNKFPADRMSFYQDYPDENLNHALLYLEGLYTLKGKAIALIKAKGKEELLLELAASFGATQHTYSSANENQSDIYLFAKYDLAENDGKKIEAIRNLHESQRSATFIALLNDYKVVANQRDTAKTSSLNWLKKASAFLTRSTVNKQSSLTVSQQEIAEQWERWALLNTGTI
jgi:hypothetical protein